MGKTPEELWGDEAHTGHNARALMSVCTLPGIDSSVPELTRVSMVDKGLSLWRERPAAGRIHTAGK